MFEKNAKQETIAKTVEHRQEMKQDERSKKNKIMENTAMLHKNTFNHYGNGGSEMMRKIIGITLL